MKEALLDLPEYRATDGAGVRFTGAGDTVDRELLVDDGASGGVHGGSLEAEHL